MLLFSRSFKDTKDKIITLYMSRNNLLGCTKSPLVDIKSQLYDDMSIRGKHFISCQSHL